MHAHNSDFAKLWAALTVSVVGTQISLLALPLLAVLVLEASPLEMGVLAAAGQVPFFLFSLPAGVWVDRIRRRPLLIAADVGCALLLLSIPVATLFDGPTFVQLCVVAFGVGALTVASEIAHYAYVPALVGRERLTACNSKLQVSHSAAAAAGPSFGGLLVQILSAPLAVVADAASFMCSAILLRSIRHTEPARDADTTRSRWRDSIHEGVRMLLKHPMLRAIMLGGTTATLFEAGFLALYVLYATRDLGLNPGEIGLIFAAGGVGAVPGALMAEAAGRRFGAGRIIVGGWALAAFAAVLVPFVRGGETVVLLAGINAFGASADAAANVLQWSLRQSLTPDRLAGRVTATHRFIVYGATTAGSLAGGALGGVAGLRPTLVMCGIGMMLGPVIVFASPLRGLGRVPVAPASTADDEGEDPQSSGANATAVAGQDRAVVGETRQGATTSLDERVG
ncbi:MAG: MFS transporter [Actinomycetota bacterium]|nr:MFS transporter [Actinomycetota bacterium]